DAPDLAPPEHRVAQDAGVDRADVAFLPLASRRDIRPRVDAMPRLAHLRAHPDGPSHERRVAAASRQRPGLGLHLWLDATHDRPDAPGYLRLDLRRGDPDQPLHMPDL